MPNLTTWKKRIRGSSCPVSTWEDLLAKLLPPAKAPVLVDIGANKGYKVGRFIERWSQTPVTPKRWYGALIASAKTNVGLCGACSDCKEKPLLEHQLARWPSVRVHALELQATTRELLRRVLNDTGTRTPRRNFSAVGFIFPHFRSRERKGCVRATWCDLVLMVLDELMVLDKWPIGSQVYVFHPGQINVIHPGQIYCNAIVIDIRCSGMWREVKVHYQGWPCEYDEWILERSSRLDIRTKNDEIDVVP